MSFANDATKDVADAIVFFKKCVASQRETICCHIDILQLLDCAVWTLHRYADVCSKDMQSERSTWCDLVVYAEVFEEENLRMNMNRACDRAPRI